MFEAPILDPMRFAALGEVVEGHGFPGDLERLKEVLHSGEGEFRYRFVGGKAPGGLPMVTIHLDGWVMLTCRRCLEGFPFDLQIDDRIVMVKDEAALPELEEEVFGIDVIVQPERLDVAAMVEDEILLTLPLAPSHAEGVCGSEKEPAQQKRENPFAALAKLKSTTGI
ncbi:MAG: YceD family protein [Burkholderiales bacterium]